MLLPSPAYHSNKGQGPPILRQNAPPVQCPLKEALTQEGKGCGRGEGHQPHITLLSYIPSPSQIEKLSLQSMDGKEELRAWLHYNLVWKDLSPSSLDADDSRYPFLVVDIKCEDPTLEAPTTLHLLISSPTERWLGAHQGRGTGRGQARSHPYCLKVAWRAYIQGAQVSRDRLAKAQNRWDRMAFLARSSHRGIFTHQATVR